MQVESSSVACLFLAWYTDLNVTVPSIATFESVFYIMEHVACQSCVTNA